MEYKKQFISINDDLSLEIHYNPIIVNNPYLIKFYSYLGYTEHRLNEKDMLNLAETIADFLFDNPNTTGYIGEYAGICRLWQHRRNEALEQLEKTINENDRCK